MTAEIRDPGGAPTSAVPYIRSLIVPAGEPGAGLDLGGEDVAYEASVGGDEDAELLWVDHFGAGDHRQAHACPRLLRPFHRGQEPLERVRGGESGQPRGVDQEAADLVPAGGGDGVADEGDCFVERDGADGVIKRAPLLEDEVVRIVQTR